MFENDRILRGMLLSFLRRGVALANYSRIQVHLEEACDGGRLELSAYDTATPCSLGDGWWNSDSVLL